MIVTAPTLLTLQRDRKPISNGAVVVRHGVIQAAGAARDIIRTFPFHRVRSLENAVLMPGLVNLHAHLELPALLNALRADSFPGWTLKLIAAKKHLSVNDYREAAAGNIRTLIQTGTTTIAEICTHNVSPSLLKRSGLRAVIYREVISMNPAAPFPRYAGLVSRPSGLIRFGVSPHAPHTVSERALRELREFARRKQPPLCMHVAESKDEIAFLQGEKSGFEKLYASVGWDRAWAPSVASPFQYLRRLGLLGPRFLVVHAAQATDADILVLNKTRAPVAHCPRSNRATKVGNMPLKKFLDAGVLVGLGTDSLSSAPTLNMWDEMRCAYHTHRSDGISPEDIFRLATMNGAKALGLEKEIGALKPGKKADLIAVSLPKKNTGDIYSDLLRETKSCMMSMVNGNILHLNGAQEKP